MVCSLRTTEIVESDLLGCRDPVSNAASRLEYTLTCILWRALFSALDAGDKNSRSVYNLDRRLPFVAPSVTLSAVRRAPRSQTNLVVVHSFS